MSLILEALKKSEHERQLGELPSLSTPSQPLRRRRSVLPWLVVLILVAAVVAWWLRRPATDSTAPPASAVSAMDAATPAAVPGEIPPAPSAPPAEAEQGSVLQDMRPRESGTIAAPATATTAMTSEAGAPDVAVAPIAPPRDVVEKSRQAASIEQTPAPVAADTPPPARTPATPLPAAAPVAVPAPPVGPPLMWELPYAVRKDLPEINITMQVYADNPVNRFVIVNGERLAEGEELEGLKVIEIRGDGIVFAYQSEQFLYPRGGR